PTGRSARDTRITHRRQWTADPRFGRGHGRIWFAEANVIAGEQSDNDRRNGCDDLQSFLCRAFHFTAPVTWPAGTSSIPASCLNPTFMAPAGGLNWNALALACASVLHSLIRSVYCGAPVTPLLVMTYLRGTGRDPGSIQICQSVSGVRNARCSHS